MSSAERLFDLLQALRRRRRPVTAAVLADELGVSQRTLYRDINRLKAIGADVQGEPGMGYVLKPGFLLPPLMLSEEEIEALTLGLSWVRKGDDQELSLAAREALSKIASILPAELRFRVDDSPLLVGNRPALQTPADPGLLRRAIRSGQTIRLHYRDQAGAVTERLVWPIAIGYLDSRRTLIAWCELRQDFRQFRLDRALDIECLETRYPGRRSELYRRWQKSLLPVSGISAAHTGSTPTENEDKAMNRTITLYTNPMSRGAIAHWMLEEVAAPYRTEILDFGTSMKAEPYLTINPMGKVPAIQHGDVIVTEAPAICAYLADAFPEAGLAPPRDQRGDYYRWLFFAAGPLEQTVSLQSLGYKLNEQEQMSLGCGTLPTVLDTLASALRHRPYITGRQFTAADVYVGSHIGWGMQFGTIDSRPEFTAYWNRIKDRPAQQRVDEFIHKLTAKQAWVEE
ncbi:HTH domain-containing protein [Natronospirillum operosum]|uniref:HTH domain-containing protein n=1 Tax=Natronospirillum operosum TaxID=2759953 RepID=A0A4Z0W6Q5_9GAMM|nr:HTH domain-containing protein [Natronospirillum operosum]TGG90720.1 HTH domain-containing protein [Natronospirillum operosum]